MPIVSENEKQINAVIPIELYNTVKAKGKTWNEAVIEAFEEKYCEKKGNVKITKEIPYELYEEIKREFTDVDKVVQLIQEREYLDKQIIRDTERYNDITDELHKLRVK